VQKYQAWARRIPDEAARTYFTTHDAISCVYQYGQNKDIGHPTDLEARENDARKLDEQYHFPSLKHFSFAEATTIRYVSFVAID
jgi:hypothetical protein